MPQNAQNAFADVFWARNEVLEPQIECTGSSGNSLLLGATNLQPLESPTSRPLAAFELCSDGPAPGPSEPLVESPAQVSTRPAAPPGVLQPSPNEESAVPVPHAREEEVVQVPIEQSEEKVRTD